MKIDAFVMLTSVSYSTVTLKTYLWIQVLLGQKLFLFFSPVFLQSLEQNLEHGKGPIHCLLLLSKEKKQ